MSFPMSYAVYLQNNALQPVYELSITLNMIK